MAAYLTRDPGDGKRHPIVVWAHGGFGGLDPPDILHQSAGNDQSPDNFREAGFVVMIPTFRGENDNPGKFELFCGEVDDLLSAIDYARKLPYVDPSRVYLMGHSSGGTLVLFAAEMGAPVRLVISLGGTGDISGDVQRRQGGFYHYKHVPFDWHNPQELAIRSAANYGADISVPTWYIEGQLVYPNVESARVLEKTGAQNKVPLQVLFIPFADHFTALRSTKRLIADKLLADTGPQLQFSLTAAELNDAFVKRTEAKPQIVGKPFATFDPEAARGISELIAKFPAVRLFVRVYQTAEGNARAEPDAAYDIDDVECLASGVRVVMDRRTLENLKYVAIDLTDDGIRAVRAKPPGDRP